MMKTGFCAHSQAVSIQAFRAFLLLSPFICLLACSPKKPLESFPSPSVESPPPAKSLNLTSLGREEALPELRALAGRLILAGRIGLSPIIDGKAVLASRSRELFWLDGSGPTRSLVLPAPISKILCLRRHEGQDKAYLFLGDGSLLCVDLNMMAIDPSLQSPAGILDATASPLGIALLQSGGRISLLDIASLSPLATLELGRELSGLYQSELCLLGLDSEGHLDTSLLYSLPSLTPIALNTPLPGVVPLRLASSATSHAALLPDAKALIITASGKIIELEGSFDGAFLEASSSSFLFKDSQGSLLRVDLDEQGMPMLEGQSFGAQLAVAAANGILCYQASGLASAPRGSVPALPLGLPDPPLCSPFMSDGLVYFIGSQGLYALQAPNPDFYESLISQEFIEPEAETQIGLSLDAIRPRSALEGSGEVKKYLALEAYRPALSLPFSQTWRVSIFKPAKGAAYSIFVKSEKPYLIAAYDQSGSLILNNLGYSVEASLDFSMVENKVYAIAFAPRDLADSNLAAELVIKEKP